MTAISRCVKYSPVEPPPPKAEKTSPPVETMTTSDSEESSPVIACCMPSPSARREIIAMIPIDIPSNVSSDREKRFRRFFIASFTLSLNMLFSYLSVLNTKHSFRSLCNRHIMRHDDDSFSSFIDLFENSHDIIT